MTVTQATGRVELVPDELDGDAGGGLFKAAEAWHAAGVERFRRLRQAVGKSGHTVRHRGSAIYVTGSEALIQSLASAGLLVIED